MLAYLGHKGRQAFGSNALAAHGKGAYLPSQRSKRGSGGEVGLAVDLLTVQVKSRQGFWANFGVRAVVLR